MENITQKVENINMPHILWRSIKKDGLPELFEGKLDHEEVVSCFESNWCLVYFRKADQYGSNYKIAQYIKTEFTDGDVEACWFNENLDIIENVTHWAIPPQPPTED